MRFIVLIATLMLVAAGCRAAPDVAVVAPTSTPEIPVAVERVFVYPVEEYASRVTEKKFGQYVRDRFVGYHAGDDIEFTSEQDQAREVPVVAIADGEVVRVSRVGGYGGLIITRHMVDGRVLTALYGHIDLGSTDLRPGDLVTRGQFLANLGAHESAETDGERKHLHFGLYEGSDGRVNGYEAAEAGLKKWLDPSAFFAQGG